MPVDNPQPADSDVSSRIEGCLLNYLSPITARSVLTWVCRRLGVQPPMLETMQENVVVAVLRQGLALYLPEEDKQQALAEIGALLRGGSRPREHSAPVTIPLLREGDITLARSTALRVALEIGLAKPDAVKVSTVVSELARNVLQYAGKGQIEIRAVSQPLAVHIVASDQGPGIDNLQEILAGRYRSRTGMGLGLVGSRRLVDRFDVVTAPGKGTKVTAVKLG